MVAGFLGAEAPKQRCGLEKLEEKGGGIVRGEENHLL